VPTRGTCLWRRTLGLGGIVGRLLHRSQLLPRCYFLLLLLFVFLISEPQGLLISLCVLKITALRPQLCCPPCGLPPLAKRAALPPTDHQNNRAAPYCQPKWLCVASSPPPAVSQNGRAMPPRYPTTSDSRTSLHMQTPHTKLTLHREGKAAVLHNIGRISIREERATVQHREGRAAVLGARRRREGCAWLGARQPSWGRKRSCVGGMHHIYLHGVRQNAPIVHYIE
jgi:hypothetical protein